MIIIDKQTLFVHISLRVSWRFDKIIICFFSFVRYSLNYYKCQTHFGNKLNASRQSPVMYIRTCALYILSMFSESFRFERLPILLPAGNFYFITIYVHSNTNHYRYRWFILIIRFFYLFIWFFCFLKIKKNPGFETIDLQRNVFSIHNLSGYAKMVYVTF